MSVWDDAALAAKWDAMAPQWTDPRELQHPGKRYIAAPTFRSLWGDIRGLRVLDAGCGGGWLTRLAAQQGAHVDGVDFSAALIAWAREVNADTSARHHVMNLCDLSAFGDGRFDLLISHCCLQDVRDYRAALREMSRTLRADGRFIISVVHPWTWQDGAHWGPRAPGELFTGFIEDCRYLEERFDGPTMFHRPMAVYAAALSDAGLGIRGILEPRPGDELAPLLSGEARWERWRRVPDFLFFHGICVSEGV